MLFDKENIFSDGQEVKATAASENVVSAKGILSGLPCIPVKVQVVEKFAGLTSLTVAIQTSATEDFSQSTTLVSSGAIPAEHLVEGYVVPIDKLPKSGNLGYLRAYYTVAGTGTAGKITAGVIAGDDFSYQDM